MRFISEFIQRWKQERKRRIATRKAIMASFAEFVAETRPSVPKAPKYSEAALYRQVWKRAVALEFIALRLNIREAAELYRQFGQIADKSYDAVAPSNAYGKVRLKLNGALLMQLVATEKQALLAKAKQAANAESRRARGVVYLLKSGPDYKIGQTSRLDKRLLQISPKMPNPIELVHQIRTNDPVALERQWHIRFASKRKRGEWFSLDENDIVVFTSQDEMWVGARTSLLSKVEIRTESQKEVPLPPLRKRVKNWRDPYSPLNPPLDNQQPSNPLVRSQQEHLDQNPPPLEELSLSLEELAAAALSELVDSLPPGQSSQSPQIEPSLLKAFLEL